MAEWSANGMVDNGLGSGGGGGLCWNQLIIVYESSHGQGKCIYCMMCLISFRSCSVRRVYFVISHYVKLFPTLKSQLAQITKNKFLGGLLTGHLHLKHGRLLLFVLYIFKPMRFNLWKTFPKPRKVISFLNDITAGHFFFGRKLYGSSKWKGKCFLKETLLIDFHKQIWLISTEMKAEVSGTAKARYH